MRENLWKAFLLNNFIIYENSRVEKVQNKNKDCDWEIRGEIPTIFILFSSKSSYKCSDGHKPKINNQALWNLHLNLKSSFKESFKDCYQNGKVVSAESFCQHVAVSPSTSLIVILNIVKIISRYKPYNEIREQQQKLKQRLWF